ncbi:MAG: type II toxin-antitoxin system ParD family antitoxin [bacterium]
MMMKRITISLTDEQQSFVKKQSEKLGNQSEVIREALDRMRKQEMIDEMQEHFREETTESEAMKDLRKRSFSDLPDY